MDKARLIFRINGEKKSLRPKKEAEIIEITDYKEEIDPVWSHPQQGSLALREHDFRHTQARSRQLLDEWIHEEKDLSDVSSSLYSPYFVDSREPIIIDDDYSHYNSSNRKRKYPFFRYFSSIGGAVVTGFLMGIALLTLFVDEDGLSKLSAPFANETPIVQEDIANSPTTSGDPAETPGLFSVPVSLPAQPYFMIQAGVFSETSGAETLIEQLEAQGYRAMLLPTSSDVRVYLGVSGTKEDAVVVASHFKNQGIETFVKTFAVPSVDSLKLVSSDVDPASIATFLQTGERLFQELTHLQSSSISGMPTSSTTLEPSLKEWMNGAEAVRQMVPVQAQKELDLLLISMKEAVALQLNYQSDASEAKLWQSQAYLMDYAVKTQQWVQSLSGQSQP
jgi:hypothetical protein